MNKSRKLICFDLRPVFVFPPFPTPPDEEDDNGEGRSTKNKSNNCLKHLSRNCTKTCQTYLLEMSSSDREIAQLPI